MLAVIITGAIFLPVFVSTQEKDKYGLNLTAEKTKLLTLGISKQTPETLAATIVTTVLMFVGTIFFLLVLYAGLTWMTAGGSSEKVTKAKSMLETAIIGLLIVAASYAISTFVFERLTTVPEEPAAPTSTSP